MSNYDLYWGTGRIEIADYLIEKGADVNFVEEADDDPGMRAPVIFDAISACITSLCYKRSDISDQALVLLKKLIDNGVDLVSWAERGYYPEPSPGPKSRVLFIEPIDDENGLNYDRIRNMRDFLQEYFGSRNIIL